MGASGNPGAVQFTVKIAYADKWRDYPKLEIKRNDLYGNARRANEFRYADMVSQLGKPVDRTRWGMTPQTVNAYYNASNNEIVFPAAILQPAFFDVNADDAVNYGAIGAVIGHEIGHGFDDQGRKSDGDGNPATGGTRRCVTRRCDSRSSPTRTHPACTARRQIA